MARDAGLIEPPALVEHGLLVVLLGRGQGHGLVDMAVVTAGTYREAEASLENYERIISSALAIREKVIPHLRTYASLKVWIAGCGTGEEVYSLAILFREEGLESKTLFYGTDISPDALAKATVSALGSCTAQSASFGRR